MCSPIWPIRSRMWLVPNRPQSTAGVSQTRRRWRGVPGGRRVWPHQAHEQRIFEQPLVALLARLAMNCKAGVHLGDHGCEVIGRIAAGFEAVEVTADVAHHRFRPVREGAGRDLAVEGAFRVEQERAVGERVAPARRWRAGVAVDDRQELRVRDQLEIVLLGHMPFDHLHGVFASELRQIEQEARLLGMEWRQRRAGEDDVEVLFAMRGRLGKRRRQRMQQHVGRAEQSRRALTELEMLLRAIADRGIVERVIVDVAILEGIGVVTPDHLRNGDLVEILGQQPLRAQRKQNVRLFVRRQSLDERAQRVRRRIVVGILRKLASDVFHRDRAVLVDRSDEARRIVLRKHRQDRAGDEYRDVVAGKQRLEFSCRLRNRGIVAAGKRGLGVGLATQRPQRQRLAQPGAAAHVGQAVQDRQALLQKAAEDERAALELGPCRRPLRGIEEIAARERSVGGTVCRVDILGGEPERIFRGDLTRPHRLPIS